MIKIEERRTIPITPEPTRKLGDESGPTAPKIERPSGNELLRRMKNVDPDRAKKYRQRSGQ
jgi:hypothetical protein